MVRDRGATAEWMNGIATEVCWSAMLAARECAGVEGLLGRKAVGGNRPSGYSRF